MNSLTSKRHARRKNRPLGHLMLSGVVALMTFVVGPGGIVNSSEEDDRYSSWYFTAEEVQAAYQYQQNYGERLRAPLPVADCMFRERDFSVSYRGHEFTIPCRFVDETTRHLREMLGVGAAKYLFPLDADHAHLGVPIAVWNKKYQHLPPSEVLPAILRDPGLVALYHTAEHLRITDRKSGAVNPQAKSWQEKRNVLGYFDGRPIQILIPHPNGQGVSMPEGYYSYSGFTFLASPKGELFLSLDRKVVTFDIALDGANSGYADEQVLSSGDKRLLRYNR